MNTEDESVDIRYREALSNIKEALQVFPFWKAQFQSVERKKAAIAFRRIIDSIKFAIASAAEIAKIPPQEMSNQIFHSSHFTSDEWSTLLEVVELINENQTEIFHKARSSRQKKEKIKV